ncbi:hypothetical protein EV182_002485 [Spiromyces aspiralis]|uniref:Uncharacterized protein n=1 Tax=Spiromyces aspiralis TaxID=68401 RepID=A0ACC1HZB6_9FUNG|nr:hypothetical protein EV182_002485 [Spiromyces aspiralis]
MSLQELELREEVARLEALKGKLQQLQESFNYFLHATKPDVPVPIPWPDLLGKFNLLGAKYLNLKQDINERYQEALRSTVITPHKRLSADQDYPILSVLLRTKLTPEIEAEEERIRKLAEEQLSTAPRSGLLAYSPAEAKAWSDKVELHETLIESIKEALQTNYQQHLARMKRKQPDTPNGPEKDTAERPAISDEGSALAEKEEAGPASRPVQEHGGVEEEEAEGPSLESILAFMYTGDASV